VSVRAYKVESLSGNASFSLWHCGKLKEIYVAVTDRGFPDAGNCGIMVWTKSEIAAALHICKDIDTTEILKLIQEDCDNSKEVDDTIIYVCD